jgi:glutamate racemase
MLIGFFDSGIGGLTVLRGALKAIPGADFLYYADIKNVPYGTKTKAQVKTHVLEAADFLARQGIDVLVVACNTATSVAVEDLRRLYAFPVIGMEPAVKPAVENHKDKRILVTATELALREDKLKKLISRLDCEDIVDLLPLQGLVMLAERGEFSEKAVLPYLQERFSAFDLTQYKAVVLGCTHFIFFRPLIQKLLGPDIDVIDGNKGTVNRLLATLSELKRPLTGSGAISFFESGVQVTDEPALTRYKALLNMPE